MGRDSFPYPHHLKCVINLIPILLSAVVSESAGQFALVATRKVAAQLLRRTALQVSNFCAFGEAKLQHFIHFAGKMRFRLLGTLVALNQQHQPMCGRVCLRPR
jgi:hypothetical protein